MGRPYYALTEAIAHYVACHLLGIGGTYLCDIDPPYLTLTDPGIITPVSLITRGSPITLWMYTSSITLTGCYHYTRVIGAIPIINPLREEVYLQRCTGW